MPAVFETFKDSMVQSGKLALMLLRFRFADTIIKIADQHRSELQGEFSLRWPDGFDVDEKTFLCNDRRLFGKPISHSGGGYDFVGNKIVVWLNS